MATKKNPNCVWGSVVDKLVDRDPIRVTVQSFRRYRNRRTWVGVTDAQIQALIVKRLRTLAAWTIGLSNQMRATFALDRKIHYRMAARSGKGGRPAFDSSPSSFG